MRTLLQIEPRTPIESLPFTITAPGSYFLTSVLNGGGTSNGILIESDDVSLDLNGFSLVGCTTGIQLGPNAGGSASGISIFNGNIKGCLNSGIDPGNDYGQILSSPGAGFVNSNPWANFSCATPSPGFSLSNADSDCNSDSCQNGFCQPSCPAGQTMCGGQCINTTSNPNHCGACANQCPTAAPNQTVTCQGGNCVSSCTPGFSDCDGSPANGCETDIRTSNSNCGACGSLCAAGLVCVSGACVVP